MIYSEPYYSSYTHSYKQTDKMQLRLESMMHNEVNIEALTKAVNKLQADVEKLKDKQRSFANGGHE